MKRIKREDLMGDKKYLVELEFAKDDNSDYLPLGFWNGEETTWVPVDTKIYSNEGKAEESPRYVKNIIKKLKELDEHNRNVWLNRIMDEFGGEIRTRAYRDGFEQGKLEGNLEREKVKLPKIMADKIEYLKQSGDYNLFYAMDYCLQYKDTADWLEGNQYTFARAWFEGYEVEKEPLYWVRTIKGTSLMYKAMGVVGESAGSDIEVQERLKKDYTFTEKEIKDYDERYWAFAVPVEEEDNDF